MERNQTKEPRIWLRRDLVKIARAEGVSLTWVVGDPVRSEFFQFSESDFAVLEKLQEPITARQLWQSVRGILPHSWSPQDLGNFLSRLTADNLLVVESPTRGRQLFGIRQRRSFGIHRLNPSSLLGIKLWSFSPRLILGALQPLGALIFGRTSLLVGPLLMLATLVFATLSFPTLLGKIPAWQALMAPQHLLLMLFAFGLVKTLHELGHGLACEQSSGDCEEMGILLLVGFPCLYCDVTSMWLNPSRFRRILVSLGGIYVELLVALLSFWCWYFSVPGAWSTFWFSLMTLTSLNTLLLNGNPLLRYDGYFVLSDLVGVPNLASDAQRSASEFFSRLFFKGGDGVSTQSFWKIAYALGSFVYRNLISLGIVIGCYSALAWHQLQWLGMLFAGILFAALFLPAVTSAKQLPQMLKRKGKRPLSWLSSFILAGALAWLAFFLPLPHHVLGKATIFFEQPQLVYASHDGPIEACVTTGTEVQTGAVLFRIKSPAVEESVIEQQGKFELASRGLAEVQALISLGQRVEADLELARERVSLAKLELDSRVAERASLEVLATRNGRVVPRPSEATVNPGRETGPTRNPLDPINRGKGAKRGELLCLVAEPDRLIGIVPLSEKELGFIQVGQRVEVFSPFALEPVHGVIQRITQQRLDDSNAQTQDGNAKYLVEFSLLGKHSFRHGSTTRVAIPTPPLTLAQQLYQLFRQAFFL
jgi:putative peptide zinc metalloprotease protein